MVSFVCNYCQETLKKAKLDPHTYKCRNASFTCIDCNTDFHGFDYRNHTSCISEEQKYQKSLYKGNKNQNKKMNGQNNKTNSQKIVFDSDIKVEEVKEDNPIEQSTLKRKNEEIKDKDEPIEKQGKKTKSESKSEIKDVSDLNIASFIREVLKKKSKLTLSKLTDKVLKSLKKENKDIRKEETKEKVKKEIESMLYKDDITLSIAKE